VGEAESAAMLSHSCSLEQGMLGHNIGIRIDNDHHALIFVDNCSLISIDSFWVQHPLCALLLMGMPNCIKKRSECSSDRDPAKQGSQTSVLCCTYRITHELGLGMKFAECCSVAVLGI